MAKDATEARGEVRLTVRCPREVEWRRAAYITALASLRWAVASAMD
jgi:hypothetical protein